MTFEINGILIKNLIKGSIVFYNKEIHFEVLHDKRLKDNNDLQELDNRQINYNGSKNTGNPVQLETASLSVKYPAVIKLKE